MFVDITFFGSNTIVLCGAFNFHFNSHFNFHFNSHLINKKRSSVAVAVFAEEGLYVFRILGDTLGVAVVAVDEDYEMGGRELHLGAFVIAGGCADTSLCITIDGQSVDIYHTSSDAFIGFAFAPYAECQGVTDELISIETTNAIAIGDGGEVYEIYEGVTLI